MNKVWTEAGRALHLVMTLVAAIGLAMHITLDWKRAVGTLWSALWLWVWGRWYLDYTRRHPPEVPRGE